MSTSTLTRKSVSNIPVKKKPVNLQTVSSSKGQTTIFETSSE